MDRREFFKLVAGAAALAITVRPSELVAVPDPAGEWLALDRPIHANNDTAELFKLLWDNRVIPPKQEVWEPSLDWTHDNDFGWFVRARHDPSGTWLLGHVKLAEKKPNA